MNDYLEHYNHNHDALGRFTGSGGANKTDKALNKYRKKILKNDQRFISEYASTAALERQKIRNIRRSDQDVNEIALNKIVNKNIDRLVKNGAKYCDKYYNKGFDFSNEKDRIEMAKYYTNMELAKINITTANHLNKTLNGRNDLAKEAVTYPDPLYPNKKLTLGYSYRTTKDIKREQKENNRSGINISRDNYGRVTNLKTKNTDSVSEVRRINELIASGKLNTMSDDEIRKYIKRK